MAGVPEGHGRKARGVSDALCQHVVYAVGSVLCAKGGRTTEGPDLT